MTDREAIAAIQQRAWTDRKPGLEQIRTLLERLGNPQKSLRFVHIAGSNGKGSTAAMTAAALTRAGLRTGLYTSPHLWRFHERFQVDGRPIPPEGLAEIASNVLDIPGNYTEFELMTAIGMLWFQKERCDWVVLETGLGGRLDSTNVIEAPGACVITRIGLEHTQLLGDTLEKIAAEKAGIIKPGCPVIVYRQEPAVLNRIKAYCKNNQWIVTNPDQLERLSCTPEGQIFTYRGRGPFSIALLGQHQLENAAAALDTLWALGIPEKAIAQGLKRARWPGRLELLGRRPDVLLDGGHNPQCMEAVARTLGELYPGANVRFVLGVLGDKDYPAMVRTLLPLADEFFCVTPDSPRALPAEDLAACVRRLGGAARACPSLGAALAAVFHGTGPEDVICMCGSLYMIGEIRECLIQRNL